MCLAFFFVYVSRHVSHTRRTKSFFCVYGKYVCTIWFFYRGTRIGVGITAMGKHIFQTNRSQHKPFSSSSKVRKFAQTNWIISMRERKKNKRGKVLFDWAHHWIEIIAKQKPRGQQQQPILLTNRKLIQIFFYETNLRVVRRTLGAIDGIQFPIFHFSKPKN